MPVTLVFKDQFLRAAAATLGGNYTAYGGGWALDATSQAKATAAAWAAYKGIAPANCQVVAAEGTPIGTSTWGVFARGVAPYSSGSDSYYAAEVVAGTVRLIKVVAGALTVLAGPTAITRTVGAPLILDVIGTTLQLWYNGTLVLTATDSALAAGGALSTGLINASGTTYANRFDARWDDIFPPGVNAFTFTPVEYSEVVEYDSGFTQRNLIWTRPRYLLGVGYEARQDADKIALEDFRRRRRGMFQTFLIQDPTDPNPGSVTVRDFATADGVATVYKIREDQADSITTYTDGVLDSPQPTVSLSMGLVIYTTPLYAGARLSYKATNAYYRGYFAEAQIDWQASPATASRWKTSMQVIQDKMVASPELVAAGSVPGLVPQPPPTPPPPVLPPPEPGPTPPPPVPPPPPPSSSLSITPQSVTVNVGGTAVFTATVPPGTNPAFITWAAQFGTIVPRTGNLIADYTAPAAGGIDTVTVSIP